MLYFSDVSDVLLQSIFKLNDDEKLSYKYYNKRITARDNGNVQSHEKEESELKSTITANSGAYRRVYTANSSLRSLNISQESSTNSPGLEERSFSPSFGRNNGNRQKKRRSRTVVLLVAVIEGQQIGHGWVSLCVFWTSMPKKQPLQLKE